ncbi:MAG: hypothetical protein KAI83_05610 [Thiomargarita sp.]|nr:hypothetical protein [Thiomargarita sp.]
MESNALGVFFSFGCFLESNASALGVFWSPTLQLWVFFGVQRFSFGCFLESNASALGVFLESRKKHDIIS